MHRTSHDFAEKLFDILEDRKNYDTIRWSDSNQSFLLIDPANFARTILEMYFRHKNLNSFVRQLNKYDFHKVKPSRSTTEKYGENVWEFKHTYFQRGRRDLISSIKRKKTITERRNDFGELSGDVAEKNVFLQNQMLNTLRMLSRHFQVIVDDLGKLRRFVSIDKNKIIGGRNKMILLEENPSARLLMSTILEQRGFMIYLAESLNDVLVIAQRSHFDLIVLSVCPNDNLSLISDIRTSNLDSTLAITGMNIARDDYIWYQDIGVDEFIYKPFSEYTFISMLRRHEFSVIGRTVCQIFNSPPPINVNE